jgi:hypothetical protein
MFESPKRKEIMFTCKTKALVNKQIKAIGKKKSHTKKGEWTTPRHQAQHNSPKNLIG